MTNDKLISYTVIQEFGAPYWTADLKYEGSSLLEDDPTLEGYFELHQTDTTTKETRMIFAGFPIKLSWTIKKGILRYTLRAVSNGWYLTQQNVPRGSSASECIHYNVEADGTQYKVVKYARRNEEMLIWDYLFNATPTDPEHASYCSVPTTLANNSNISSNMASATMFHYPISDEALCGMHASDEMIADRACAGTSDWDCPDCQGHESSSSEYWGGEDRRDWVFNYKTKTKHSAITEMASYCDRVFHFRINESSGKNYAYWTPNTSANTNTIEPFSVMLTIDTADDDSLVDLKKHEQYTEHGTPNCVYAYSQGATTYWDSLGLENIGNYPAEWYETSRPVIHNKQKDDYSQAEINAYAQAHYDSIHGEDGNRYTANLVSTISERTGSHRLIAPGSRIQILGVDADLIDPATEYRIMKITHRKLGGKPATTAIEFSKVNDLAHPFEITISMLGDMLSTQIKKEKDKVAALTPEEIIIEPVLIQSITDGLATVQVLNSTAIYENVIHLR